MPTEPRTSYREILKLELADRVAQNPAYSLRAMAKQAKVSPALLSGVLRGKKGLSLDRALEVARHLQFDTRKTQYFSLLVQLEATSSEQHKVTLLEQLKVLEPNQGVQDLSLDLFRTIADWYHLPMLELTAVKGFAFTPKNIALALSIPLVEAEAGFARLQKLELIEEKKGRWKKTKNRLLASSPIPNYALRRFHDQMLRRAIEALPNQTAAERFVGSETMAFDEKKLPQAQEIFEDCFNKLVHLAATSNQRKAVYHFGLQFFRLTVKDAR